MHLDQTASTTTANRRRRTLVTTALVMLCLAGAPVAHASDARPKASMQSLDQQVQDIKSDVLAIAAELRALEEQLLHPSSTQVAVFVEVAPEQDVVVDSVQLWIGAETVAHHIYSHDEVEALRNGGVQRIYTGNLAEGQHEIRVVFEGRRTGLGRFESTESFVVEKGTGPKKVGVTLSTSLTAGAQVAIADW